MIKEEQCNVKRELLGFTLGDSAVGNRPYLDAPRGIAVNDRAGIMYLCDMFDRNIHVFSMEGEHITSFGKHFQDKPWGILLYEDVLFVTDVGKHSVIKFRDFLYEEVSHTPSEFNFPRGMSIATKTNELLIADANNQRVVVYSIEPLRYRRVFAKNIPDPCDVNICNKTDIVYVLNSNSPFIYKYSLSGELLAKLFYTAENGMVGPWFFCLSLDYELFIFSDYKTNQIRIFDRKEKLVELINSFSSPVFGVAVTSDLKLIVGSCDRTHKIKIFQLTTH